MIDIDELERITCLLLRHVKEQLGNELELENDYYWSMVDDRKLYNPFRVPKQRDLGLGQLSDDWDSLNQSKSGDMMLSYHLRLVSSILLAIANEHPSIPIDVNMDGKVR